MEEINKKDISSDESECNDENIDQYIFVDLIGFNNRHQFICKEFCLLDSDYKYHAIIKPPYDISKIPYHERCMVKWEINHLHGLGYDKGDLQLMDVIEATYKRLSSKVIIMENKFKTDCLKYMFRNCCYLECLGIDELDFDIELQTKERYPVCGEHTELTETSNAECAVANAFRIKDITSNNLTLLNFGIKF